MKRGVAFAVLAAPAAVWASISLWAEWTAGGWTPAAGELSLPVRIVLASNQWAIRGLPFAAVGLAIVWPLIVLGIAAVCGRSGATWGDVIIWWCVSGVVFATTFLVGGVYFFRRSEAELPGALIASVAWIGVVAFWVSVATAYAVQREKYLARESVWHPGWMLAGLAVLNCVGLYAVPVLATIAFRKGESTQESRLTRGSS